MGAIECRRLNICEHVCTLYMPNTFDVKDGTVLITSLTGSVCVCVRVCVHTNTHTC